MPPLIELHLKNAEGRPPALNQEELNRIIEWICASQGNRRTAWIQIPITLELNIGFYALRTALRNAGFARRVARRKPPVSETNRRRRLQWATEHVDWSIDQWKMILWSDETWVNGDRHTKTYVTRRKGEEHDPTCVIERYQRRKGWMFWGCFHSSIKGPGIF
jgi:Transposase